MLTDIFRATAAIQDVRMCVWEKLKSFNVWDWERNFFTGLVGRGSSSGGVTERLPFARKTRQFQGELKWHGSFRWNVFAKKVIPSEVFLFLAFTGIPGNLCTICSQLPVPGYFREDSNAQDGGF